MLCVRGSRLFACFGSGRGVAGLISCVGRVIRRRLRIFCHLCLVHTHMQAVLLRRKVLRDVERDDRRGRWSRHATRNAGHTEDLPSQRLAFGAPPLQLLHERSHRAELVDAARHRHVRAGSRRISGQRCGFLERGVAHVPPNHLASRVDHRASAVALQHYGRGEQILSVVRRPRLFVLHKAVRWREDCANPPSGVAEEHDRLLAETRGSPCEREGRQRRAGNIVEDRRASSSIQLEGVFYAVYEPFSNHE